MNMSIILNVEFLFRLRVSHLLFWSWCCCSYFQSFQGGRGQEQSLFHEQYPRYACCWSAQHPHATCRNFVSFMSAYEKLIFWWCTGDSSYWRKSIVCNWCGLWHSDPNRILDEEYNVSYDKPLEWYNRNIELVNRQEGWVNQIITPMKKVAWYIDFKFEKVQRWIREKGYGVSTWNETG